MKKTILCGVMILLFFAFPAAALPAQPVPVEILYMNHGPLQPTIREIRALCEGYGKALAVAWYDFESPAGEKFMAKKGITQHVPLVIWIAGRQNAVVDGREIQFVGFPSGSGPAFFQGKWTVKELRDALDQAVHGK